MRGVTGLGAGPRAGLVRIVAIALAQVAATIAIAFLVRDLFNAVLAGRPIASTGIAALVAATAASVGLRYLERVAGENYGQSVVHAIRGRLAHHLMRLPVRSGVPGRGEMLLRFVGDLTAVRTWHVRGVAALIVGAPVLLGAISALLVLDWRIGIAATGLLSAAVTLQMLVAPRFREAGVKVRRKRSRLAAAVTEGSEGLATFQLFGRMKAHGRRIDRRSAALADAMRVRAHWSGLMRAAAEVAATGLPMVMLAIWSVTGTSDVGTASAALALSGLLVPRIREIGRVGEYWQLARVSEERIRAFLAREAMDQREGGGGIARDAGRLALRDLGADGLFNGLSAEVPAGARVALSGPTGAGKTRLLNIIAGLESPDHGKVVIDGRDTGVRRLAALRRLVAMVGADVPLLRGTVVDNIRCGARATDAEAEEILAMTGWERFVAALPDGRRTRVHSGGRGLSAGQRTRVSLIRALMRKPVLLLLDDIDGTLDEESELILAAIFVRFEGTIIMVTQNARWRARCDTIWWLENGELRRNGDERRTAHV